jgi:hypothetical protein
MIKTSAKVSLVLLFVFVSLFRSPGAASDASGDRLAAGSATLQGFCNCNPDTSPRLDPTRIPIDVSLPTKANPSDPEKNCPTSFDCPGGSCQPCFDCFGWQLFIDMNWPAASRGVPDPNGYFGRPGDGQKLAVWETYRSVYDLFADRTPPPWAGPPDAHREIEADSAVINLRDTEQADHNWLTDWDGNQVRYEIRLNSDEYEYIRRNNLWNQAGLLQAFTTGAGINLPDGGSGGVGSIEVKAAWRIVPKGGEAYFQDNYKVSRVDIPGIGPNIAVALVGMHIIKRTPKAPQWIWATFEHKDNAPDEKDAGSGGASETNWNFFNPKAPSGYKPNYKEPPDTGSDPKRPVQVVRVDPISPTSKKVNDAMHQLIASKFPRSVWLNYELVDVQWPGCPQKVDPKGPKPNTSGKPLPQVVANITMETYLQHNVLKGGSYTGVGGGAGVTYYGDDNDPGLIPESEINYGRSSCIGCHRLAARTPPFKGSTKFFFTDYSNVFFKAQAVASKR